MLYGSLIFGGYIVCLWGGGFFAAFLCDYLEFADSKNTGIKRAGMIIGMLERFIVLTFVLTSHYEAIAFVFAAKSIARFEELKNRKFSEYYLVGTLASFAFAIMMGETLKMFLKKI